jgi:hypothetical protein
MRSGRRFNAPKVWINFASTTIYKNTLDRPNDEATGIIRDGKSDNMPYNFIDQARHRKNKLFARLVQGKDSVAYKELDLDFSVQVCKLWEKTFFEERTPLTRKITFANSHCVRGRRSDYGRTLTCANLAWVANTVAESKCLAGSILKMWQE